MAKRIAVVSGTALVPGVSKNGRLYTRAAIARAVARAQDRIGEGSLHLTDAQQPLSQRTHHMANDDTASIVGRLTSLTLAEDGSAKFTADIANTPKGQTIAALADTSDGRPAFLRGVSIRGAWASEPRTVKIDGREAESADDLILHGLDYTGDPGVPGAVIDSCVPVSESVVGGQTYILESVQEATVTVDAAESAPEALVTAPPSTPTLAALIAESGLTLNQIHTELGVPLPGADGPADLGALDRAFALSGVRAARLAEAAKPLKSGKPATPQTPAKSYADPGYQPDKMKRYGLDDKKMAKAAWSYINQADNAKDYTANQLKRIKNRIVKALKSFGVTVTAEHWLIDPAQEITESTTLAECMACYDGDGDSKGSFYVTLTNGPVSVSVSSYVVDPADLDLIGRAAMDGAVKCLATIDPDLDGDMDVPGASAEDTDRDMPGDANDPSSPVPGTPCPCGCGCAIPVDPGAANCPCACGDCETCGSTPQDAAGETVGPQPTPDADAPTPPIRISVESAPPTEAPAPDPAAESITETEAPAMAEPTTPAVEPTGAAPTAAPAAPTFTFEQMMALLAAAGRPVEAAPTPVAPVAEAAPAPAPVPAAQPAAAAPVVESAEQMTARLIAENNRTLIQSLAESGMLPGRRGLTAQSPASTAAGQQAQPLAEGVNAYGMPAGAPDKPLHQYTTEELNRWAGPMVFEHAVGHYATRRG